jgi:hypothetical protein
MKVAFFILFFFWGIILLVGFIYFIYSMFNGRLPKIITPISLGIDIFAALNFTASYYAWEARVGEDA